MKEGLLHVEIQSDDDKNIEYRLAEYNLLATITYDKPIISFLILLRPMPNIPESPFFKAVFDIIEIWHFNYVVIKLWEISAEELMSLGLFGLLPLVPLTQDGTRPEILKEVADTLFVAKEKDLLALAKMIVGLVLKRRPEKAVIERMFEMYREILEDSWVYQKIKKQAKAEGKAEGKMEGLAQGEQRVLLAIIQRRFPGILETAGKLIAEITDAKVLEDLAVAVSVAQTPQEALQALNVSEKK
ncbi:MAG: hypothetical protein WCD86_18250 [Ktedonobacteraceae bacterium]